MQSKDDQIQVIGNLKNISMASSKLLLAAKSLSVDPGAANAKNLLAVAARCDNTQKTSIGSLCFYFFIIFFNKQECLHINFTVAPKPLWNWSKNIFKSAFVEKWYLSFPQ